MQLSIDETNDLKKRMKIFKNIFNQKDSLSGFDRHVFESIVDEIILGKIDEDGNKNPYHITFVFKTGLKTDIERKTKKSTSKNLKDTDKTPSYSASDTR